MYMDFLHKKKKCEQCDEKFATDADLIHHARHIHHHDIVKCDHCGKEFIHEKDRLHHAREEHEKEMKERSHRESFGEKARTLQDSVDDKTKQFSDNL